MLKHRRSPFPAFLAGGSATHLPLCAFDFITNHSLRLKLPCSLQHQSLNAEKLNRYNMNPNKNRESISTRKVDFVKLNRFKIFVKRNFFKVRRRPQAGRNCADLKTKSATTSTADV